MKITVAEKALAWRIEFLEPKEVDQESISTWNILGISSPQLLLLHVQLLGDQHHSPYSIWAIPKIPPTPKFHDMASQKSCFFYVNPTSKFKFLLHLIVKLNYIINKLSCTISYGDAHKTRKLPHPNISHAKPHWILNWRYLF